MGRQGLAHTRRPPEALSPFSFCRLDALTLSPQASCPSATQKE